MARNISAPKIYTPFLKWKRGEMWALKNLRHDTKKRVLPILDLIPHDDKSMKDHAEAQAKQLGSAWGDRPVYIDTQYCGTQTSSHANACKIVFDSLRSRGCSPIPVTSLSRSQPYQISIRDIASSDDNGVLIRLTTADFNSISLLGTLLNNLIGFLGLDRSDIDIAIDYGAFTDQAIIIQLIRSHINSLPNVNAWRSLIIGAGCFPSSIKSYAANRWHLLPRLDWGAWTTSINHNPPLSRLPRYGDYGIRDPGLPPAYGSASSNLRYTTTTSFLCRIGDLVKNGGAQQMPAMCASLMSRQEYSGSNFSAGDAAIAAIATNSGSSGGPQQWVQWCLNHHFEFVVDQL